jgi:hypothetical protein
VRGNSEWNSHIRVITEPLGDAALDYAIRREERIKGLRTVEPIFIESEICINRSGFAAAALVGGGDVQIFAVFGYGAAGDLNSLPLQHCG